MSGGGERTEAATGKRLGQLRARGQIARSQDLTQAVALLASLYVLQATGPALVQHLQDSLTGGFGELAIGATANRGAQLDVQWAGQALTRAGQAWLFSLLPLFIVLPLLGVGMGLVQSRFMFNPKLLFSGFGALNPLAGFKRIFSPQSLVVLLRSLVKVLIIGGVTFNSLQDSLARFPSIQGTADPRVIAGFMGGAILGVAFAAAQALLVLGIVDYAYARWSFKKNSKMTKQEVKEEAKQSEQDPQVKAAIRRRRRKLRSFKRQLEDVPKATVVVTNPTHLAVALQYDQSLPSPRVLAKGADYQAQRIREAARFAGVPIVENKPLARSLYAAVEAGDDIPLELYQAVAEVLAYVFSLRRRRRLRS